MSRRIVIHNHLPKGRAVLKRPMKGTLDGQKFENKQKGTLGLPVGSFEVVSEGKPHHSGPWGSFSDLTVKETSTGKTFSIPTGNAQMIFGIGRDAAPDDDIKVGDPVHLGFGAKGGVGFKGVVTAIQGTTVEVKNDMGKTYSGLKRFVTKDKRAKDDASRVAELKVHLKELYDQLSAANRAHNTSAASSIKASMADVRQQIEEEGGWFAKDKRAKDESTREAQAKAEKLQAIDNRIWGKFGWGSGGEVRRNWDKYKAAVAAAVPESNFSVNVYEALEDENFHSMNQALVELGKIRTTAGDAASTPEQRAAKADEQAYWRKMENRPEGETAAEAQKRLGPPPVSSKDATYSGGGIKYIVAPLPKTYNQAKGSWCVRLDSPDGPFSSIHKTEAEADAEARKRAKEQDEYMKRPPSERFQMRMPERDSADSAFRVDDASKEEEEYNRELKLRLRNTGKNGRLPPTSDDAVFKKGDDVVVFNTGKIGTVVESDEDMTLVDWRNGSTSRIATSKLKPFQRSSWLGGDAAKDAPSKEDLAAFHEFEHGTKQSGGGHVPTYRHKTSGKEIASTQSPGSEWERVGDRHTKDGFVLYSPNQFGQWKAKAEHMGDRVVEMMDDSPNEPAGSGPWRAFTKSGGLSGEFDKRKGGHLQQTADKAPVLPARLSGPKPIAR